MSGRIVSFMLPSFLPAPCCTQVALFEQCGGRSSQAGINAPDPAYCCPSGSLCKFYGVNFWQCQPVGYRAPPEPLATYDAQACAGKTKVGLGAGPLGGQFVCLTD